MLTMDQLTNVSLVVDKAHTMPHKDLDFRSGLGVLKQVYGPNSPTPSA